MPTVTVFKGQQDGSPKKSTAATPELTGDKVLVRITASGVCGTGMPLPRALFLFLHYYNSSLTNTF